MNQIQIKKIKIYLTNAPEEMDMFEGANGINESIKVGEGSIEIDVSSLNGFHEEENMSVIQAAVKFFFEKCINPNLHAESKEEATCQSITKQEPTNIDNPSRSKSLIMSGRTLRPRFHHVSTWAAMIPVCHSAPEA